MIDIKDLKRGDIIIVKFNGAPYHAAIYAPNKDQIGDLIHTGYGVKRSGVIRSTLVHTYFFHEGLRKEGDRFHPWEKNKIEIEVIRSKTLSGDAIANQAEVWLKQGVLCDERKMMTALKNRKKEYDHSTEAEIETLFQYLKYTARRNTVPIKTPVFPNPISSMAAGIGVDLTVPSKNLNKLIVNLGYKLMDIGTNHEGRPKGFTCVGFVLSCIGAVALHDEIKALAPEDGWVSLKHGSTPRNPESKFAQTWNVVRDRLNITAQSQPGLDVLLTDEQIKNFNIERLKEKLTPALANINPQKPSIKAFNEGFKNDNKNWESLGMLDVSEFKLGETNPPASKPFNKEAYRAENKNILEDINTNREIFKEKFGAEAFKNKKYNTSSLFKKTVAKVTGETVVAITNTNVLKK